MDAINQIIDGIRVAFHPTPLQMALAIAAMLIFIGGLVVFHLIERRSLRRQDIDHARSAYESLKERHHLLPSDEDVIARMALSLKSPEKKHLLLSNQGLFNAAAHHLILAEEVPEAAIAALRVKLGFFGEGPDDVPVSTASLPTGAAVVIRYRGSSYRAKVLDPQTGSLRLRVAFPDRAAVFTPGSSTDLFYQNRRGTFSVRTAVHRQDGEYLSLAHSEDIERTQQREHYRKQMSLPVYVKPAASDERPVQSRFIDLGGGGASLYNPGSRYRKGDDVDLSFHPESEERLNLSARVVRTSRANAIMHVDFGFLRESVRDRIYRILFNKTAQS